MDNLIISYEYECNSFADSKVEILSFDKCFKRNFNICSKAQISFAY